MKILETYYSTYILELSLNDIRQLFCGTSFSDKSDVEHSEFIRNAKSIDAAYLSNDKLIVYVTKGN